MTAPVINFGNGLRLDLSAEPWRSAGCRWTFAANSGYGKSHLVAVALEELHAIGQPFLVIDPKIGEYRGLAELPGVLVCGKSGHIGLTQVVDYLLRGAGVVVNMAAEDLSTQRYMYTALLGELWRRQTALESPRPIFVVIDEAEMFAPQKRQQDVPALEITNQFARRGRSFGLNVIFITQRPGDLEKDVLSQCNLRVVGYLQLERDFQAVASELNIGQQAGKRTPPPPRGMGAMMTQVTERIEHRHLLGLKTGEFYAVYNGKVWKLPPCRQRWTPDLATTPRIEVRQRPLFEMDNHKPAPALVTLPKRPTGGAAYEE